MNILAYDYTGYGKNRGEPSEAHVCADIEAAWKHLVETRKRPSICLPAANRARPQLMVFSAEAALLARWCLVLSDMSPDGTIEYASPP